MNANLYLFLAYTFIWLGIFSYVWFMDRKTTHLKQDLTLLQERLDALTNTGDQNSDV